MALLINDVHETYPYCYFADDCCYISRISKGEAIKLLQHIDLTERSGTLLKKYQEHL